MPATILVPSKQAVEASQISQGQTLELAGWGLVGAFVRAWALGMQRRPVLERPHLHLLFAAGFAGIGYWVSKIEKAELDALERERDKLVKRRMLRLQGVPQ
ncbi:uncharacterized protein SPPG_08095 [Spizellomyces punctatus DAOM BR117]|uniref:NADH-ubiquinone oxidoreductase 14 kDa subunit n=1 Tax=Spizellomyces punctatus (strain DAOM BR117) TaxID=645134 RepID=A0A0L0H6G5_SPIPD|nr:uncharacterized protein SPPG_08095 [Spizellomyces punctatus DAOM BR117]KNC96506.1 hypothetical protein SPPG_08095 [Spizellomyces punctatus DAOM BR117]|eukprot:XP_016604546.1 hypothetical protein SPPG_08095 [Spizellomyces punctatus DAOM BR117]